MASKSIRINGRYMSNIRFADDIALFSTNEEDLQAMLDELNTHCGKVGLKMNKSKTKIMSSTGCSTSISLENDILGTVDSFTYLGKTISFKSSTQGDELNKRISNAWKRYWSLKYIFKNKKISLSTKSKVFNTCILPILSYGAQTWAPNKEEIKKVKIAQRKMERSILGVRLVDKFRNEYLRNRTKLIDVIRQARKLKWKWAGHVKPSRRGSFVIALLPGTLALHTENNVHHDETEQDETIDKCEQEVEIYNDDEVDNTDTNDKGCINTPNICLETTCDALRKPERELDESLTTTRKLICLSDSNAQDDRIASKHLDNQKPDQDELPTSEISEPITAQSVGKVFSNNDSDVPNIVIMEDIAHSSAKNDKDLSYICEICHRKFKRENLLLKHVIAHNKEKPFTCKLCRYTCKYNSLLVRHIRTHTGERQLACELCPSKFMQNSHLVNHMRTHSGEKPFACKLCNYKFAQNSHLVKHMRTHTGERPFACKLCSAKFTQSSNLVNHMRTHTAEKPFACNVCPYKCTEKGSVVKHMRTHTGEKPFACALCNYQCTENSHLVRHMRTHTGEKPFACKLCQYRCIQNASLLRHMRTHSDENK
ncbi:histone-lysine N-methyltransferase PRDM9-like [Maniola jurtina]|uniref:histone-lysine N-methyltransferase PRDM9-like n=1 Tax=Maniola jurtina TaxID=191418 RepID=UPI001E68BB31|nr:histone-lysine N-methyltransferase PRDM9-like [Maniola jurtina]